MKIKYDSKALRIETVVSAYELGVSDTIERVLEIIKTIASDFNDGSMYQQKDTTLYIAHHLEEEFEVKE